MADVGGATELEEIDDTETLVEIEEFADEENSEQLFLGYPFIRFLRGSYDHSPRPILLLDSRLNIVYKNQAFTDRLDRFYRTDERSFPVFFQTSIENDTVGGLCRSLGAAQSGFSWKGTMQSKMKGTTTMQSLVYIYPLFDGDAGSNRPMGYAVFFDDITEDNRKVLRTMFMSLLEASKLKDNDTGKHIERVNLYSRRMAEELYDRSGYPQVDMDYLENIGFLAAMHDVGKIGTPDDILNKAGPLTPWEWDIMKEHTINGAFILSTYPNPMAREIALSHHEMWDGKGYPYHLEGSMIPLSARIVTIADVYDALRTKRSYKPAFDHGIAIEKIEEWNGSHFDPSLLALFEKIEKDFDRIFTEHSDEAENRAPT
jgi:hypothetical protein